MDKIKYLQLKTLDRHLREVSICGRPSAGWIRAIRSALQMTAKQLGERLGISQQGVNRLEQSEIEETITIKSLRKLAAAMDCRLVYAVVPNQSSLEKAIKKQAYKKAKEIVLAVDHSMKLEAQGVGNVEEKIKQVAEDLTLNLNSKIWDD